MKAITTKDKCEAAAKALKLSDDSAKQTDNPNRPEGCYWFMNEELILATNTANKGNGAEQSDGTYSRHPICESIGTDAMP